MLMLFVGILFGLAVGLILLRAASMLSGWQRWSLGAGAGVAAAALPVATAFIGAAVVHRFSKSCRKRPLRASEIRIVRRAPPIGHPRGLTPHDRTGTIPPVASPCRPPPTEPPP